MALGTDTRASGAPLDTRASGGSGSLGGTGMGCEDAAAGGGAVPGGAPASSSALRARSRALSSSSAAICGARKWDASARGRQVSALPASAASWLQNTESMIYNCMPLAPTHAHCSFPAVTNIIAATSVILPQQQARKAR